jgi:flagellar hook-associated protein 3 FlgL
MISGTRYQMRLEVNRQLRLAGEIARAQAEISSRKRILAPSDDPAAAARVSDIARTQANQATWKTNLERAAALAASADNVLETLATRMDRAAELMIQARSSTVSADNRRAIAAELASIAEEVAVLRDTRDSRGEPLFSTATDALRIPVGPELEISAVGTRSALFDGVATAGGPADLVAILTAAASAVAASDLPAIGVSLDAVNAGVAHVAAARGEQGARGARIDALLERQAETAIVLAEERSGLEDADIMDVVARLQSRELSLQAAQAVFAKINQNSLFDLLR